MMYPSKIGMKNKENDKFHKIPRNYDEDQCNIINKNKEKG